MSHVEGLEPLLKGLDVFGTTLAVGTHKAIDEAMEQCQKDAVALIPVATGQARNALASPEALKRDIDRQTGRSRWAFGLITPKIAKQSFYLFWLEFGRKARASEDLVGTADAGRKKRRRRARKKKRAVSAMAAHPWFRPARDRLFLRLQSTQGFEDLAKAAKRAAGLADGA